jgi:hypothetical protein
VAGAKRELFGPNYGRILEVCQIESPGLSRKMIRITRSLGFVSVKPLEVLLTRDDVTLYDVLDDRNLFDECKEQNPKLIAYLSRGDNLRRLLQFVMDRFDEPEVNRTKSVEHYVNGHRAYTPLCRFQHIATEVLCSDIDAFVDACLANDDELLRDFWKSGMTTPRDEQNNVLMTHFCKVLVAFLTRKPHEVSDATQIEFFHWAPDIFARYFSSFKDKRGRYKMSCIISKCLR